MEKPTEFDLNQAVIEWRKNMAISPACMTDDLNELETHLRDSVALLQTKGLTAEESFLLAVRRIGGNDALELEFGKVNAEQVWLNRALWMVMGYLMIGIISAFCKAVTVLCSVASYKIWEIPMDLVIHQICWQILYVLAMVGICVLVWRWTSKSSRSSKFSDRIKDHPLVAVAAVSVLSAAVHIGMSASDSLALITVPVSHNAGHAHLLGPYLYLFSSVALYLVWPIALGWLLFRKPAKPFKT